MSPQAVRSSLTSSFSVSELNNEVVCPLINSDGSQCRKRCLGEKKYRSIQEHLRRAHPDHYIPKLPATEESFKIMVSAAPRQPPSSDQAPHGHGQERVNHQREDSSAPNTPNHMHDHHKSSLMPVASAAAALAQLHNHRRDIDWESEGIEDWPSDAEAHRQVMRSSIELPRIHSNFEPTSDSYSRLQPPRSKDLSASFFISPPYRSSTLPPIQRNLAASRPRKQSVCNRARDPQHRRQRSKDNAHLRRMSYERKAYSVEPSSALSGAYGKRWEDLIDAATSATEDADSQRTPIPPSPISVNRTSLPPFSTASFQSPYQASPLQQALTPPAYLPDPPEPFSSVESNESGGQFHVDSRGLSDSSPSFQSTGIQIYCAACQGISQLRDSYACTECICGICQVCVDVLMAEHGARRKCPRCATIGGRFKPFQLDIR